MKSSFLSSLTLKKKKKKKQKTNRKKSRKHNKTLNNLIKVDKIESRLNIAQDGSYWIEITISNPIEVRISGVNLRVRKAFSSILLSICQQRCQITYDTRHRK